jgi:hypothetical protein
MYQSQAVKRVLVHIALAATLALGAVSNSFAQEKVRPEVGKPLQAAQDLMKSNRFKEALAKVREADAITGKTPYETYMVDSMRGSAAVGARELDTAIKSFEAVVSSGKAPAATQLKIVESLATMYYGNRDYASAIKWGGRYFKEGGNNSQIRTLMIQSYFQSGDFAASAKESLADIEADEKAGRPPSEEKLQLLANSYLRQKNTNGYIATIEKLLNHYPKKSLWADVISRLQKKPGFSDRLALDVYRLQFATGNLTATNDYMEMAQLALQGGYIAEGKKVIDEGFSNGALGKGAEAERHKRLRDLAEKKAVEAQKTAAADLADAQAAKDGNALVRLGYAQVTAGQATKGAEMIEAGIKKGGLKRPEDARMYLGMAYLQAGQKSKGISTLKGIKAYEGGLSDIANLWALYAQRSA